MISSHSSTTYGIYSPLRITWRTRSVQQIAQSMCLVQLIPSTYPVTHIKLLCLLVRRPLTWSPINSLGPCKQKNGGSLETSGMLVGWASPSLVQVLTTLLYSPFFIYFSGTSSTMAWWHLCLSACAICLSLSHCSTFGNTALCWYSSLFALTDRSPKPHSLKWGASTSVIETAHCNGTSLHYGDKQQGSRIDYQ